MIQSFFDEVINSRLRSLVDKPLQGLMQKINETQFVMQCKIHHTFINEMHFVKYKKKSMLIEEFTPAKKKEREFGNREHWDKN